MYRTLAFVHHIFVFGCGTSHKPGSLLVTWFGSATLELTARIEEKTGNMSITQISKATGSYEWNPRLILTESIEMKGERGEGTTGKGIGPLIQWHGNQARHT